MSIGLTNFFPLHEQDAAHDLADKHMKIDDGGMKSGKPTQGIEPWTCSLRVSSFLLQKPPFL